MTREMGNEGCIGRFIYREERLEERAVDSGGRLERARFAHANRPAHEFVALERVRKTIQRKFVRNGHDKDEQDFVDVLSVSENANHALERFCLRAPGALTFVETRVRQRESDVKRKASQRRKIG